MAGSINSQHLQLNSMPAVLVTRPLLVHRTRRFFPNGNRNHRQYSFCLPTEEWPGWAGLSGLVKYQYGRTLWYNLTQCRLITITTTPITSTFLCLTSLCLWVNTSLIQPLIALLGWGHWLRCFWYQLVKMYGLAKLGHLEQPKSPACLMNNELELFLSHLPILHHVLKRVSEDEILETVEGNFCTCWKHIHAEGALYAILHRSQPETLCGMSREK